MRFKMDRLCELAGVPFASRRGRLLRENKEQEEEQEEMMHYEDMDADEEEQEEGIHYEGMDADEEDEVVEVDEVELVQELRRARQIMQEGKRKAAVRKRRRQQALQEAQLKAVIDQEVKNVIKEMDLNLNANWMYGKRKPQRSRKGYTHQGSYLKGFGFK